MKRSLGLACAAAAVSMLAACGGPDRSIEAQADLRVPDSALLLERLAAGDDAERVRAARAIGRIQSPAYVEGLAAALDDGNAEVRVEALFALGQLGLFQDRAVDPRAAEAVRPWLRHEDPATLVAALEALGKLAEMEDAGAIAGLLAHERAEVRAEAAYALFRLRFAPLWRREVEEPPALPGAAVAALTRAMSDPDGDVRFAATYAFSRHGDERARDALLEVLDDGDPAIRLFAARGLGLVADDAAVSRLVERLADDDAGVRVEAVGALGRAGAFEALEGFRGLRRDPSFHVRAALARALGDADSVSSGEMLERLAGDASVSVRVAAIDAMSRRSMPGVLEDLSRLLDIDDWRIRAAAARAAAAAGDAGLEAATAAYRDADVRVRTAVLEGLAGTGVGDEIVVAAIAHNDLALRGTAVGLVAEREHLDRLDLLSAAFNAGLWEDYIEVREAIVDALADVDGSEPFLRRAAEHDDAPSVRAKAAAALGDDAPPPLALPVERLSPWIGQAASARVMVDLLTRHGTMRIEVLTDEAPVHAAAFLDRVDRGFYDGLIWHRVVSNFVIQGGDPRGDGWGSAGETLRDEINRVRYGRGAVGMPKAGKDTGGCQLFVTHVPTPHLDGNYTVFGQVVDGLDVIDRVEVGDEIVSLRRAAP